jgi:hypothetical protein
MARGRDVFIFIYCGRMERSSSARCGSGCSMEAPIAGRCVWLDRADMEEGGERWRQITKLSTTRSS